MNLKALELGKEGLLVLELKLKVLIMDSIHFIDTDTRRSKEWQWQNQLRWECARTCTHMYTCVHVLIA